MAIQKTIHLLTQAHRGCGGISSGVLAPFSSSPLLCPAVCVKSDELRVDARRQPRHNGH